MTNELKLTAMPSAKDGNITLSGQPPPVPTCPPPYDADDNGYQVLLAFKV